MAQHLRGQPGRGGQVRRCQPWQLQLPPGRESPECAWGLAVTAGATVAAWAAGRPVAPCSRAKIWFRDRAGALSQTSRLGWVSAGAADHGEGAEVND